MNHQIDSLLNALETERRYVARELHDSVAQTTLQLGLQAGICLKLLEGGKLEMLARELAQLEERSQLANSQVRQIISDMRPPAAEPEATLNESIQYQIDQHREQGGPPVAYQFGWEEQALRLSDPQRLALIRIIQEVLLNIRKHARAQNVRLTLSGEDDNLYLTIADDGQGFDPAEVAARPTDKGGAGLANLRIRAEALGAELTVARDITGSGAKITLIIPK